MRSRRLADYGITETAFIHLLLGLDGKSRFQARGLPSKPNICGVYYDHIRMIFRIRIDSPDHDEIPEGDVIPWREWNIVRVEENPETVAQDCAAELESLRAIFSNDMLNESVVAREAYQQGWRDCQRQQGIQINWLTKKGMGDANEQYYTS